MALKLAWAVCQQASGAKKVGQRMKDFLLAGRRAGRPGHRGRRRAAGRREPRAGPPRTGEPGQRPTLGLATADAIAKVATRLDDGKPRLDTEDIGFTLAPRLNAAGRLGQPQLAVELLVTDRARPGRGAGPIHRRAQRQPADAGAEHLPGRQQAGQGRRSIPTEDAALVLADRGWHPGVIGIVAGRLAEKYHRPVVLIAWDQMGVKPGVGSARSVPGFNLHAALADCGEHLVTHGGHAAAAGLKIEEGESRRLSRRDFCEDGRRRDRPEQRVAELWIDAEAPLSAFTLQTVHQIEQLAPFGQGNARPLLCATGVTLAGPPKPIGSGGHHLSMMLTQHGVTPARRGLRRRRMGRRAGRRRRPDRRRLPAGDQQFPRPPQRRTAPGRLASQHRGGRSTAGQPCD